MLVYLCDGPNCEQRIDRNKGGWFGVDAVPVVHEDDETELDEWVDDYGLHFCSVGCLSNWAMAQEFATP